MFSVFFNFCCIGVKILEKYTASSCATSILNMEALFSSKPQAVFYQTAQCYIIEGLHNIYCHQNHKHLLGEIFIFASICKISYLRNHWFLCPVPADCFEKYKLYTLKRSTVVFTVLCICVTIIFWCKVLQSVPLNIRSRLSRDIENTEPRGLQHNSHLFNRYYHGWWCSIYC